MTLSGSALHLASGFSSGNTARASIVFPSSKILLVIAKYTMSD